MHKDEILTCTRGFANSLDIQKHMGLNLDQNCLTLIVIPDFFSEKVDLKKISR